MKIRLLNCLLSALALSVAAHAQTTVGPITYGSGQNVTVVGPGTVTTNGTVTVSSGASVAFLATSSITLNPGFSCSGGTFQAGIDTTPPTVPTGFSVSNRNTTAFTLNWVASTDTMAGVASYEVSYNGSSLGTVAGTSMNISSVPPNNTPLTPGTTYAFTVRAVNVLGLASAWSAPYSATTGLLTITPTALSLTFGSSEHVSMSFNANDTAGPLSKVELYRNGALDRTLTSPTSGSTWTFTEASTLPPGTYTYDAVAYDNVGAVMISTSVTVTVLASLPYLTDFESGEGYILGSLNQQLGWIVNQGLASVANQDEAHGSQATVLQPSVPPAQITQDFFPFIPPAGTPNIIFVDFFAKPVAEADITTATTFNIGSTRFAFMLNAGQGSLQAFNGNGSGGGTWSSTSFIAPLAANHQSQNWIRLTTRLDFTQGTWDLYADGNMMAASLGFLDGTSTALTSFLVRGDAATASEVDDILAGTANPLFADVNNDGIDDAWEIAHGLSLSVNNRNFTAANGQTVLQDYLHGIDPNDTYGGVLPVLTSLVDPSGVLGPQGLVSVKVTRASDGTPLVNAPITLAVTTGASTISTTTTPGSLTSVNVLTNSSGIAQAYATFTGFTSDVLVATAQSGSQTISLSINIYFPSVAAPVFNPVAGTYASAQTVTITSATSGAAIRYTTDGSTPTETNGTVYSGQVSISTTTMLKAIAYENGFADSPVASGTYTISIPIPLLNVLYNFTASNNGLINLYAALVQGSDGNFYGTTPHGGSSNDGTVFKMTPAGVVTTLVSFTGANGANASAALVQGSDGNFYGTTEAGGSSNEGTVFKMTPAGVLTTLVVFNGANGIQPEGLTQGSDGNFYGTTYEGGSSNDGIVFKMTPAGALTTLASFATHPAGVLVQGSDGNFYGTTVQGGSNNVGTVFKVTSAGVFTTLVSFDGANGTYPFAGVVQGSDGNFYGTTYMGGSSSNGTIFKMTPAGVLTTLVSFSGANGSEPRAALAQGSDGNFYGTTYVGGSSNEGVVFKMTPAGVLTALVSFTGADGAYPYAGLVQGSDGNFYGTIPSGGSSNDGVIFQLIIPPQAAAPVFSPPGGTFTSAQTVTITSTTNSASIRYTTDGSMPSETAGILYSGSISIGATTTLKAIAYNTGHTDSPVTSGTYTINIPPTITSSLTATGQVGAAFSYQITASNSPSSYNATGFPPGLSVNTSTGAITGTPTAAATSNITISANNAGDSGSATLVLTVNPEPVTFTISPVSFTYNGGAQGPTITPSVSGATFSTSGTASATAAGSYTVTATATGNYTGTSGPTAWTINKADAGIPTITASANPSIFPATVTFTPGNGTTGAYVWSINGNSIATYNGSSWSPASGTYATGTWNISGLNLLVTPASATNYTVVFSDTGNGNYNPMSSATMTGTVLPPAPVFSPAPGTYANITTFSVTISDVPGATIYYTTDGTIPTTTSTQYTGAVSLSIGTTTLTAIAINANGSSVVTAGTYILTPPPPQAPVFNPPGGTYNGAQSVTIESSGATAIYYTTDGSTPTTSSTLYSGPISISTPTTLSAIGVNAGGSSPVSTSTYTIVTSPSAPVFAPAAGTYGMVQSVTITSVGATSIYYTTDGSTPTTSSTLYAGPVSISTTTTLSAIGVNAAGSSPMMSGAYTINLPPQIILQPAFALIHSFTGGNDGINPMVGLIQGIDGRLYGTSFFGGANGVGAVFAVNPDGTGFTTLYSFTVGNDGHYTWAGLIQGNDGRLYGTTANGGANDDGTLFAVNPDGTGFTTLHGFTRGNDGATPMAGLIQGSDGRLYGTTNVGGANGDGTVFAVNTDGTGFGTLYNFTRGNDGAYPAATLFQRADGRLYGTTQAGGANDDGALFAVNPDGTGFTTLHSFTAGNDGSTPQASLIQGIDGRLYGTTFLGGANNNGTAFAINPDGTGFGTLHNFTSGSGGILPSGLMQGIDGRLYGTADHGGITGNGTVFVMNPDGTGFTTLYSFAGGNAGMNPDADLIQGIDGRLYGTTYFGGANGDGTIFALSSPIATVGQNVTYSVTASGPAPLSYQWQFNGVNIPGATSATLTLSNVNASNNGSYTVVVSNAFGSVTSDPVALTVIIPPPPSLPVFTPAAGTFTSAKSVAITSAGATAIYYTTDGTAPTTSSTLYAGAVTISNNTVLQAIGVNSGGSSPAASSSFTILPPAPVFSPAPGTYSNVTTFSVTITDAASATLYYTTDGSTPTTASTQYSAPIPLPIGTTTLAVIAINANGSSVVTAGTYILTPPPPPPSTPVFSPAGGTYTSFQLVTITSAGATSIYYTTDGSTPISSSTRSSMLYSSRFPVNISASATLQAIGVNSGGSSPVTSDIYTIVAAAPVFSPAAGMYTSAQLVTITTNTGRTFIRYTTDGTTPTSTFGTAYSGPVSISTTGTTLKAIAYKPGLTDSTVTSGTYTIGPLPSTPVFLPPAGTYGAAQSVTITSAGADSIYYTTDGSVPTTSSTLYAGTVSISTTTTLSAIGVNAVGSSPVTSGTYTINLPPQIILQPVFALIHSFNRGNDGANPYASVIQGSDGRLYGTASAGGTNDVGTVFAVNPDGTGFTTLHSFTFGSDGFDPMDGLIQGRDGRLYGTASIGGADGTVFAMNHDGTGFTTLYGFTGGNDGGNLPAGLIQGTDGRLYGTAAEGGAHSVGTVFVVNPDGTGFTTLHSFTGGNDGAIPIVGLIQGTDGRFYGTTNLGGSNNYGTVFAINPDGTGFGTLHNFTSGSDGGYPLGLMQGTDSRLYGTTESGGANGDGSVFVMNPDGTGFTTLYGFTGGNDGAVPLGSLIQGIGGRLYGTAAEGGAHSVGTVFVVKPDGTGFTTLYDFTGGNDGENPRAGLIQGMDGRLYGTAESGGANGSGTLFAISSPFATSGKNVTYSVTASGTAPLSYQWQFNGVNIPGATSATLNLTNVNTSNSGSYTVVVSNAYGSVTSDAATLNVLPPPSAPVFAPPAGTYTTAQSVSITSAGATNIYYTTDGSTPTTSSTLYAGSVSISTTTTLSAIGVNANGSSPVTRGTYTIGSQAAFGLMAGGDAVLWQDASSATRLWGRNNEGQLGDGTVIGRSQMSRISGITQPLVSASLGEGHGLAVTQSGQVYTWGDNYFGQLGDGTQASHRTAAILAGLTGIVQVAAGDAHSLALGSDGTVWAWGGNQSGQLGDGTKVNRSAPVQIPGLANIVQVAAGARHSAALDNNGTVWVWGSNEFGQLGGGAAITDSSTPISLTAPGNVSKLVSGRQFLLALKADGTVWAWGDNHAGQLGVGTTTTVSLPQDISTLSGIKALAAGSNQAVALDGNGNVWAWGANDSGQLGNGTNVASATPVSLGLTGVQAIAAGYDHVVVLKADGTLAAWGLNTFGQLGNSTTNSSSNVPLAVAPPND